MMLFKGKSLSSGVAIGKIKTYSPEKIDLLPTKINDIENELNTLKLSFERTISQLIELEEKARVNAGDEAAELFISHQLMLQDEDFINCIKSIIINERTNAAWAVQLIGLKFAKQFSEMDDEYFRERAADVIDVSHQIISFIRNVNHGLMINSDDRYILIADDLTPSETIKLNRTSILAIVTRLGSANSHTAILARALDIPAVVATSMASIENDWQGLEAIVDSENGNIYIDPDMATFSKFKQALNVQSKRKKQLLALRDEPAITQCGRRVKLYANIGSVEDVSSAVENGAEGIGLLRSEFLFLGRTNLPSEDEQFHAYRSIVEGMNGKRVIIRTIDLGADKQAEYLKLPVEDNPAMGCRAIRLCIERPEMLITQLRAILRASAFGRVAIMYPMITAVWELELLKSYHLHCCDQLLSEGIAFDNEIEVGIMIETPASALISDLLAKEVDFFSIGTNDLAQYTLAVDRQHPALERYNDPMHPALLKLIEQTCSNAHKNGIWVGICGELAVNPKMSEFFINSGVSELSGSPAALLPLKEKIKSINIGNFM